LNLSGEPIPEDCILNSFESMGAINGVKRWRSQNKKRLYTWDSLHGEIEVFNKRGKHLGVLNCEGTMIKSPVKGRKIYV